MALLAYLGPLALDSLLKEARLGSALLLEVQSWKKGEAYVNGALHRRYQSQGYSNSYVTHIDGMETGKIKVKVMEGKVNKVNIVPVDADGNPTGKPFNTPAHIIMREVPFKARVPYNPTC